MKEKDLSLLLTEAGIEVNENSNINSLLEAINKNTNDTIAKNKVDESDIKSKYLKSLGYEDEDALKMKLSSGDDVLKKFEEYKEQTKDYNDYQTRVLDLEMDKKLLMAGLMDEQKREFTKFKLSNMITEDKDFNVLLKEDMESNKEFYSNKSSLTTGFKTSNKETRKELGLTERLAQKYSKK